MNGPFIAPSAGNFTLSLLAVSNSVKSAIGAPLELQGPDFAHFMDQEKGLTEFLNELKDLLPEQDFSQIEALISDGNGLPPAVESEIEMALQLAGAPFQIMANPVQDDKAKAPPALPAELPLPTSLLRPAMSSETTLPSSAPRIAVLETDRIFRTGTELYKFDPETLAGSGKLVAPEPGRLPGGSFDSLQAEVESLAGTRGWVPMKPEDGLQSTALTLMKSVESPLSARTDPAVSLKLDTPLGSKGWDQGVSERILWMLGNSIQGASLRITPAHLGPIEIQISMQQDQASVSFSTQHTAVREALEASIPRLREMFQENNLQLVNVDVGQRGGSQQRASEEGGGGRHDFRNGMAQSDFITAETEDLTRHASAIEGLLDDYA